MAVLLHWYTMVIALFSFLVWFRGILYKYFKVKLQYYKNNNLKVENAKEVERLSLWTRFKLYMVFLVQSLKSAENEDTILIRLVEYAQRNNFPSLACVGSILVFANSRESVRRFYQHECCNNRAPSQLVKAVFGNEPGKGIAFSHGDQNWRELRKYTLKTLGQLGFGKNDKMRSTLNEELNDLLNYLETLQRTTGNKIQVKGLFQLFVLNVIWGTVGGKKFEINDSEFQTLKQTVVDATHSTPFQLVVAFFTPKFIIRVISAVGFNCNTILEALNDLNDYFKKYIEKQQSLGKFSENRAHFVDHFLCEIEKYKDDEKLNKIYNVEQLAQILVDFFGAGMDTTSSFMECSLMYMVLNPHVQIKVQQEIDNIIGRDSPPMYAIHKKSMPYTFATIAEIHRLGNIIPTIPRVVSTDCKIENQTFKKGTFVFANQTYLRMNDLHWDEPKVFRPERFLDSENNLINDRVNHVMAFGTGVRMCPGENIATSTIFMFFTGILQRFSVAKSDEKEFIGLTKSMTVISSPEPFHITLHSRVNQVA